MGRWQVGAWRRLHNARRHRQRSQPTHTATTTGPSRTFLRVRLCLGMENDGNDGRNLSFAAWPSYWPGAGTMICSFEYTEPCGANRLLSSSTSPFTVRGLQQRKKVASASPQTTPHGPQTVRKHLPGQPSNRLLLVAERHESGRLQHAVGRKQRRGTPHAALRRTRAAHGRPVIWVEHVSPATTTRPRHATGRGGGRRWWSGLHCNASGSIGGVRLPGVIVGAVLLVLGVDHW